MTIAQLGIEHLSLFGSTARGGAREESDIDLFFDYKRQKGKVGLFDLVDVNEPSRSSSTMTRAFYQLSAAARGQLRYPAELIERDAEQERAEECGAKADAGIQPDRRPPVLGSGDCEEPEVRFEKLPCTMKPAITESPSTVM